MGQHFKILTACRNVEEWIARSVQSVQDQTYDDWQAIIINDCSTDRTWQILQEQVGSSDKYLLVQNKQRKYKLHNFVDTLLSVQPAQEDVLIILDADDWFYDENVLGYLAEIYKNPDIWITWGSYINFSNRKVGAARKIPKKWSIRTGSPSIFTHLKSFKYFLWQSIKDEDFRTSWSNEYYITSDDNAFMRPMIEMAGSDHRKFIDRILYVYNDTNPLSDMRVNLELQLRCSYDIKRKPPYSQISKLVS